MSLSKITLLYNTLKFLRFKQINYRLYYKIRNTFFRPGYSKKISKKRTPLVWESKSTFLNSYLKNNTFNFLNINHSFQNKIEWNYNKYGKLWTYNLNYFDFLNQQEMQVEEGIDLIQNYIDNDAVLKDGKEPYPVSLRGINWVKFLSQHNILNNDIDQSLYNHYHLLINNLEYHLLGNHLLENGFSLFFGSYYFKEDILYAKAKRILLEELEEQILNDGAHFELSPMYHQILLHRLLDCINLAVLNAWKEDELLSFLKRKAIKMLSWLAAVTYKNGSIPMVNDSAHGIALTSRQLFSYADNLSLQYKTIQLSDSGYRKFTSDNFELFLDIEGIKPSYQPGHAHADTFSFELYVNNKPFLVDPGVSTYEINEIRKNQRSTAYHNTVTINDENSSQVWSGFRVAKRAEVTILNDDYSKFTAVHNGYKKQNILCSRTVSIEHNELIIEDVISKETIAKAHFHLYPECSIMNSDKKNIILVDEVELSFIGNEKITIEEYQYALGFNKTIAAKKIVVLFTKELTTKIKLA